MWLGAPVLDNTAAQYKETRILCYKCTDINFKEKNVSKLEYAFVKK